MILEALELEKHVPVPQFVKSKKMVSGSANTIFALAVIVSMVTF